MEPNELSNKIFCGNVLEIPTCLNITYTINSGMSREEILAYLAGIIDGEGSLMIRRSTYRMRNPKYCDCKNPVFNPRIGLKNANEDVIKLMKNVFGGHYHKYKRLYPSPKWGIRQNKIMYSYGVEHRLAERICIALLPYLIIKKEQANKLIELQNLKRSPLCKRRGGQPYSKEIIEKFEQLYMVVKTLNH